MAKKHKNTSIDDELEQSIYINPLTDFGFKKLFQKKELMIPFLNDVVRADITDIQYEPTEGLGSYPRERKAIFDILCKTVEGEQFIVEMQLGEQTWFRDRALFYVVIERSRNASHAIRRQAPRKKYWNYELKTVYVVSILNFIVFKEEVAQNTVIERVKLYREKAKTLYSEKLNMVFVELPKFRKKVDELQTNEDIWMYLLKHTYKMEVPPAEITGEIFKLFLEEAKKEYLTQEEMETYSKSLRQSYEIKDIANFARIEGLKEGEKRGEKRGLLEGEKRGLLEGKKRIAFNLMQKGMAVDEILSVTGLTYEQIHELLGIK
jgi:predicted transposase/invertase (TIGR01784 family)